MSNFSRRSLMKGAAGLAGLAAMSRVNPAFAQSTPGEKTTLLVIFLEGGYNSLFASADSFLGTGNFGTSAGTVKQLGGGLAIDLATFGTMPQYAQDHMASVGIRHGLTPRARIRATAKIGTDPTIMLTGPVPVTEKILRDNGMSISDIDLFEVNEAFAAVVLRFQQAFDVDPSIVNVNGGSIAMGHPLGATGAIIIGTLLDELERSGKGVGLATLCIASGMGAATIIERV